MKIKIIAGTMVALSFSLMSCSDFLTEDPRGKLTPENFFSTQDELNMSIYALYQKVNLSQVYTNMQLPQWQLLKSSNIWEQMAAVFLQQIQQCLLKIQILLQI